MDISDNDDINSSKGQFLVYHKCSDKPVLKVPFDDGFPGVLTTCPNCFQKIKTVDEMVLRVSSEQ